MNILLIDNYDSFTYNIAHIVRNHDGVKLTIIKADKFDLSTIKEFSKIIFSPGPDIPAPGNMMERILNVIEPEQSVLGICLGLQAIYLNFGGRLKQLGEVVHGQIRDVTQSGVPSRLFKGVPATFQAGFYHSWIADNSSLPGEIDVTAFSQGDRIMAIKHRQLDIEAVQFHPESIMTPDGNRMITNWIRQ